MIAHRQRSPLWRTCRAPSQNTAADGGSSTDGVAGVRSADGELRVRRAGSSRGSQATRICLSRSTASVEVTEVRS